MAIFGNSIWQLIYQSDWVTWIVLGCLLILSIICWTIFFYKIIVWRTKERELLMILSQMKAAKKFEDLIFIASKSPNTLSGYFLAQKLALLKSILEEKGEQQELTDREWNFLKYNIDSLQDNIMHLEETELPLFSVTAGISPLLGLFGTIWGLVHAFIDISKKQSADITTVAPGIAEALITTLAGLMVAIPAMMMYYYLKLRAESIEQALYMISDRFLILVQKLLFNKRGE